MSPLLPVRPVALVLLVAALAVATPAAAGESAVVVFRWEAVAGAKYYELEVAEDAGFARIVFHERCPSNSYRWRTTPRSRYYWRVRAVGADGRASTYSAPRTLAPKARAPRLVAPQAGATITRKGGPLPVLLRWKSAPGVVRYRVQVARDSGFSRSVVDTTLNEATEYRLIAGEFGTYYWRVGGLDFEGRPVAPSKPRSLTIEPPDPSPWRPIDGSEVALGEDESRVWLRWRAHPATSAFEVEIAQDRRFRRSVARARETSDRFAFTPERAGTWFWRVRGVDPRTGWSRVARFSVGVAAAVALAPEDGSRFRLEDAAGVGVSLSWEPGPDGAHHRVEISCDRWEAPRVEETTGAALALEGLQAGEYAWTVTTVSSGGAASPPSAPRRFAVVLPALLAAPLPRSPAAGAEITAAADATITLAWEPMAEATSYEVELAPYEGAAPLTRKTEQASAVLPRPADGALSWRVRAVDELGRAGEWSATTGFSLHAPAPPPEPPPVAPEDPPASFTLGPRIGVYHNFGEVLAPRYGAEAGFRLPSLERRLGVSLRASYYTASQATRDAAGAFPLEARVDAVPLSLVAFYALPAFVVEAYLGAGVQLDLVTTRVTGRGGYSRTRSSALPGGTAVLGLQRKLGFGLVFIEAAYALLTPTRDLVEFDPGGLTATLGYRVEVW